MARKKGKGGLVESVLDRLIDAEPRSPKELSPGMTQSFRQIKASLRRDLEWLLNSRQTIIEVPDYAKELPWSVFVYGLPDLTSFSLNSARDQEDLLRIMETTIAKFEPRLTNTAVTMLPVSDTTRVVRFQIEGLMRAEPAPERVVFDTVFDTVRGEYQVGKEDSAG